MKGIRKEPEIEQWAWQEARMYLENTARQRSIGQNTSDWQITQLKIEIVQDITILLLLKYFNSDVRSEPC